MIVDEFSDIVANTINGCIFIQDNNWLWYNVTIPVFHNIFPGRGIEKTVPCSNSLEICIVPLSHALSLGNYPGGSVRVHRNYWLYLFPFFYLPSDCRQPFLFVVDIPDRIVELDMKGWYKKSKKSGNLLIEIWNNPMTIELHIHKKRYKNSTICYEKRIN